MESTCCDKFPVAIENGEGTTFSHDNGPTESRALPAQELNFPQAGSSKCELQ